MLRRAFIVLLVLLAPLAALATLAAVPALAQSPSPPSYPAVPLLSTGTTVVGEKIEYPKGDAHVTAAIVTLAPGAPREERGVGEGE
jgi:hypothetical protein